CNHSWNSGTEGPSDDPATEELRLRQIKNFLTILLISQGTPMMLMGDEARRTQLGNNNAYCHDSPLSWFDWELTRTHAGLLRFTRELIYFTRAYSVFHQRHILTRPPAVSDATIIWHGVRLREPDFGEHSHSLAFELIAPSKDEHVFVIVNAFWEPLSFEIPPPLAGRTWRRLIDTSLAAGQDCLPLEEAPRVGAREYLARERSTVVLASR
ncbi:MAG: glycogen debranching enzyme, partial [Desulfomonilia bacterium]